MGTNYYAIIKECDSCKRNSELLHIGKSSAGWQFLFRLYEDKGLISWKAWKKFLANKKIEDEYGHPISYDEFVDTVLVKTDYDKRRDPYETYDDEGFCFLDADFC
jgi:hypothetical protein